MRAVRVVLALIGRNSTLGRLTAAYGLFVVSEYASWVAVLVYAFRQGGATESGLVAVAQLLPAAAVAPWLSSRADSGSPGAMLRIGYVAQAVGMTASGLAMVGHAPLLAYGAAVFAAMSVVSTRPAQMALLPALATTPEDLTGANIAFGWVENAGVVVAGLLAGVLLSVSAPAVLLFAAALLVLVSASVVLGVSGGTTSMAADEQEGTGGVAAALKLLVKTPAARSLVSLLTLQEVVLGALDVLYVVLAIEILRRGSSWTGYLQTAFGLGGVAAGVLTALLVGRRLSGPIVSSGLGMGGALALTALRPGSWLTAALLAGVGASRAVFDVAGRTLLQRAVPVDVLGRVFGLVEGLAMAGLALGSLLVPLLIAAGGPSTALVGAAAVLPVAVLLSASAVRRCDRVSATLAAEIALLRSVPLFTALPPPALEGLAGSLEIRTLQPDATLIREGEVGHHYFVIGSGELTVSQGGRILRRIGAGDGVGEIALIRDIPRTATVTAVTTCTVYALGRDPFVAAVTGHAPTHQAAHSIVDSHLSQDR